MSESSGTQSPSSDPLKTLADALETAAQAAREGAADARATVNRVLPEANRFLSRFVYNTCYTFSYGLVFPTVLLAKSIPSNNAAMHGFVDGAHAAMEMVDQLKPHQLTAVPAVSNSSLRSRVPSAAF
jgi:hypothetical protein